MPIGILRNLRIHLQCPNRGLRVLTGPLKACISITRCLKNRGKERRRECKGMIVNIRLDIDHGKLSISQGVPKSFLPDLNPFMRENRKKNHTK